MPFSIKGRYRVRLAENGDDVRRAQRLRYHVFIRDTGAAPRDGGLDEDRFDAVCDHILIEESRSGELVGCFRLLPMADGSEIDRSYSADFYDLSALRDFADRMVEMGRFCVHPDHRNGAVLRVAWSAMTRYVEDRNIKLLFGCSSFQGRRDRNLRRDLRPAARAAPRAEALAAPAQGEGGVPLCAEAETAQAGRDRRDAPDAAALARVSLPRRVGQRPCCHRP